MAVRCRTSKWNLITTLDIYIQFFHQPEYSIFILDFTSQWAKSPKKTEGVRFFVNSAFKLQCHIVKNTVLQTAFLAILPTGWSTGRMFKVQERDLKK